MWRDIIEKHQISGHLQFRVQCLEQLPQIVSFFSLLVFSLHYVPLPSSRFLFRLFTYVPRFTLHFGLILVYVPRFTLHLGLILVYVPRFTLHFGLILVYVPRFTVYFALIFVYASPLTL